MHLLHAYTNINTNTPRGGGDVVNVMMRMIITSINKFTKGHYNSYKLMPYP